MAWSQELPSETLLTASFRRASRRGGFGMKEKRRKRGGLAGVVRVVELTLYWWDFVECEFDV